MEYGITIIIVTLAIATAALAAKGIEQHGIIREQEETIRELHKRLGQQRRGSSIGCVLIMIWAVVGMMIFIFELVLLMIRNLRIIPGF